MKAETRPLFAYLSIVAVAYVFLIIDAINAHFAFAYLFSDAWEHAGALNALMESPFDPRAPHVVADASSARFMPAYVLAALVGRLVGAESTSLLIGIGFVNTAVFFLGVYLFSREYFRWKWAPHVVALCLLGAWGKGFVWSNATTLGALPMVAGFPSHLALGVGFISWWIGLRLLRKPQDEKIALLTGGLMLILAFALLTHVLTAVVTTAGLFLIAVFERQVIFSRRVAVILAIPVGVLLMEMWPYYSTLNFLIPAAEKMIETESVSEPTPAAQSQNVDAREPGDTAEEAKDVHPFYRPVEFLTSYGIGVLGFLLAAWYLIKLRHLALVFSLFGLLGIFLVNIFWSVPLGHRTLLFAGVFAHLLLSAFLIEALRGMRFSEAREFFVRSNPAKGVVMVLVGVSVIANVAFAAYRLRSTAEVDGASGIYTRAKWEVSYREISAKLAPDSIVMAARPIAWPLPAFKGRIISSLHGNPFVPDPRARESAVKRFFNYSASEAERDKILNTWSASHLLLFRGPEFLRRYAEVRGKLVAQSGPFALYELDDR